MPFPEGATLNPSSYSPLLTGMAQSFLPGFDEFVAKDVFPTVPVGAPTGAYNIWTRGDFLRRGGKALANYEAAPIEGFSSSSGTYSVSNWGVATMWTARDLADARRGGTSDADFIAAKVKFVTLKGALEREVATATLCQTTANWSTTNAGVASSPGANQFIAWDQAASDPVSDLIALIEANRLLTGVEFNTLVLPILVLNALRKNVSLIDRVKYGGTMANPTEVTLAQIKALFNIKNVVVPRAVYNSAKEGATAVYAYIWSKTVWLGHVTDTPNRETPSAGYNFAWSGDTNAGLPDGVAATGAGPYAWGSDADAMVEGLRLRRYRQERPQGEFIESELWITPNVTAASLGTTLTAAIA